jgi:hypothetical protein
MKKQVQFKNNTSVVGGRKFNYRSNIDVLYNSKDWKNYRLRFLGVNPKCYVCVDPSMVVDHVTPHKGDVKLFQDPMNHIPLCTKCHNTVTTKFDKFFKPGSSIETKLKWLSYSRHLNGSTIKVKPIEWGK